MTAYADAILAEASLAGYWKLNEPSGTTANDSSPSPVNGTYVNVPTFGIAGPIEVNTPGDTAVSLASASSEEITIPDNAKFDFTTAFTIECWVKPAANPGSGVFYTAFAKMVSTMANGDYNFSYTFNGTQYQIQPEMHNGTLYNTAVNLGSALSTSVWTHLAMIWNGSTVGVYRDGVVVGTPGAKSGNMTANANSCRFGRYGTGSDYWNGGVGHLALYNAALPVQTLLDHVALATTPSAAPQALRPDADTDAASWGTTPLWSKLNDESDATVVSDTLA